MIMTETQPLERQAFPELGQVDPLEYLPGKENPENYRALSHADIVFELRRLVTGCYRGVLATLDEKGAPSMRWMGSVVMEDLGKLAALTSPSSRKLEQIRRDPRVQWIFINEESVRTIALSGRARIIEDLGELKKHWSIIPNKERAYFLFGDLHGVGFSVVETEIEFIDITDPRHFKTLRFTPAEVEPWVAASGRL